MTSIKIVSAYFVFSGITETYIAHIALKKICQID